MGSQNADFGKGSKAMSKTTTRPLCCTRCGHQVRIGEEAVVWADCGPAVIGDDGMVRTPQAQTEGYTYEPCEIRAYAVCSNPDCGHRWRLRRPLTADPS